MVEIAQSSDQLEIVREHFDQAGCAWASRYEQAPKRMSDLDLQLRRQNALGLLRTALRDRECPVKVLDVGCGPGDLFERLSKDELAIHGVDISPEMIAAARMRNPGNVYEVAKAAHLPFDDASMDVITSLGVLEYLPEPAAALREMRRVLRPGGTLILSFPNRGSWLRTLSAAEITLERGILRMVHRIQGRSGEDQPPSYRHRQWTRTEADTLLFEQGFKVERALFNTFGLYGHLGRLRPSLELSAWLTRQLANRRGLASRLAHTMVMLARRGG